MVSKNSKLVAAIFPFLGAFALSLGTSVGWSAFVMPATTLIPLAGPLGTTIAICIGTICMFAIAYNFHILINKFDGYGGIFLFVKKLFGYDHSFLCVWAMVLAYLAMFWANAAAFGLLLHYLAGPMFQTGLHYSVAGIDVWLREVLLTIAVTIFFGVVCIKVKKRLYTLNAILSLFFVLGLIIIFVRVCVLGEFSISDLNEGFSSLGLAANHSKFLQVMNVMVFAPWAFVGFASISFVSSDYNFNKRKSFIIMVTALVAGAIVYALPTLLSVSVIPNDFSNWQEYLLALDDLEDIRALPVFYAIASILGNAGLAFLLACVFAAIATSMFGIISSLGRLLQSMANDLVLPEFLKKVNKCGRPQNAIIFVIAFSCMIPFLGRAAIGWVTDVTSLGASIVYLYVSVGVLLYLRSNVVTHKKLAYFTSCVGFLLSLIFFFYPLIPNLWIISNIGIESYIIMVLWSIVGFYIFRIVFIHDNQNRFGKSTIMWLSMLFILLFSSVLWTRQSVYEKTEQIISNISEYHYKLHRESDIPIVNWRVEKEKSYMAQEMKKIHSEQLNNTLIQFILVFISLVIMFSILRIQQEREKKIAKAKVIAEESNKAKTMFLSNMSHDIRTPMNAIIGYTDLARKPGVTPEELQTYLKQINLSNKLLLNVINDVLEMSSIEIGKFELKLNPCNLCSLLDNMREMFTLQMQSKHITYNVTYTNVKNPLVLCDKSRMNRLLLNFISNALKFTPENGIVSVTLTQLSSPTESENVANYEFRIKDNGIGMSPEFVKRMFVAFERERSSTISGIQGTGLGMTIAKNIVDLMGGTINVNTEQNVGSEFVIDLKFRVVEDSIKNIDTTAQANNVNNLKGKRILLVEDIDINRELAKSILESKGLIVDIAINGQEAVTKLNLANENYYDAVLMDIQMPIMDGYEATKIIRAIKNEVKAHIPIIAMSANAFSEDIKRTKNAGMNAHVAKPIDVANLIKTLQEILN